MATGLREQMVHVSAIALSVNRPADRDTGGDDETEVFGSRKPRRGDLAAVGEDKAAQAVELDARQRAVGALIWTLTETVSPRSYWAPVAGLCNLNRGRRVLRGADRHADGDGVNPGLATVNPRSIRRRWPSPRRRC